MKTPRFVAALVVACLAAGALSAPGWTAQVLEWTDPAGDATGLAELESTPRPSDPELDVLTAGFAHRGEDLVASMRLQRVGIAPGSFGSVYRWYFTLKDSQYYFMARTATSEYGQLYYSTPKFFRVDPLGVEDEELKCDCKATFDNKTNTVAFAIKWASVKKALKGGDLTGLYAQTFRRYPWFIEGDIARAPDKATFKL